MIDWQRIWNDDDSLRRFSPTRAILYLFSLLYRLVVHLRNRLYNRQILKPVKLSRPVISVGNITVGGTGKTPCVIKVARLLQEKGFRPAVISRGYGGRSPKPVNIVSDGKDILLGAREAGDEPLLIARSLPGVPVLTGAARVLTGQTAINQFGAQVLICDDAFQHRQIFRDIDIVLLDAAKPLGNGHLLPAGELREPASGLTRAGCLIMTRADETQPLQEDVARIAEASHIPIFRSAHRAKDMIGPAANLLLGPSGLAKKKVCAFCGIAKPESFKKLLLDAEADIVLFIEFRDHYDYNRNDLAELKKLFSAQNADYWITTEKDAMRLADHPDFLKMLSILRMEMVIEQAQLFDKFIMERMMTLASPENI